MKKVIERLLTEGKFKKGGIKHRPTTPKPNIKPSGQRPKPKYQTGHEQILYKCERGCIIPKENQIIITAHGKRITRCPHCNSDKLTKI